MDDKQYKLIHIITAMKKIASAIALMAFMACGEDKPKELVYDSGAFEQIQPQGIEVSEIKLNHEFVNPEALQMVNDTLMAVLDNGDYVAHLISTGGNYICGFGMCGKGKGEIISPVSLSVGSDSQSVYIYDFKMARSVKFVLADLLKGVNAPVEIDNKKNMPEQLRRFVYVVNFSDTDYMGFGYNGDCRIHNVENGKGVYTYTDYPKVDSNEEYTWSVWNNAARYAVSPDREHIVVTTAIGMLFEVLSVSGGKIEQEALKGFYKPVFDVAEGAKPACVIFNDNTYEGFSTVCATNRGFYGCVRGMGPDYGDDNKILFFDYGGNLLKKYKLDYNVKCIASCRDTLYTIATDEKGEYHLLRMEV